MADTLNFVATAGSNNIAFDASGSVTTAIEFTGEVNQTGAQGPAGVDGIAIPATFTSNGSVKQTVYNVRDYGAVADGVTSDTAAIQTALDAVNTAGGGVLYFPPGTYLNTDYMSIASHNNITIRGAGIDVTIFKNYGFKKNVATDTYNMQFEDFTTNANSVGTTAMHIGQNSHLFRLSRLKLMNSSSSFCLNWSSNDALIVEDCYILDGGLTVSADNAAGSQLATTNNTSIFRNCFITKSSSLGGGLITTGKTGNLIIDGCSLVDLSNNSYAGVSIENQSGNSLSVQIINNKFYRVGINLGTSANANRIAKAIVSNNIIEGVAGANSSNGISLQKVDYLIVNDNIQTDTVAGLYLLSNGYVKATNNYVKNTNSNSGGVSDKSGIYVSGNTIAEMNNNTVIDDQGSPTTLAGIRIVGGTNSVYLNSNKFIGPFVNNSVQTSGTQSVLIMNSNDFSGGTLSLSTITTLVAKNNIGKDDTSSTITSTETTNALTINQNALLAGATDNILEVTTNQAHTATSQGLIHFANNSASSTVETLQIDDAGSGTTHDINKTNSGLVYDVDQIVTNRSHGSGSIDFLDNSTISDGTNYTKTGTIYKFGSSATQTSGTITDSSKVFNIDQAFSGASGNVLEVSNVGTGKNISSTDGSSETFSVTKAGVVTGVSGKLTTPTNTATSIVTIDGTQTLTNKTITTPSGLVKGDVGLGNVDNTSDATKNAASATLTNKTLTSPVINTPTGIVKGDVGLGNVDNTSDANKPISTATQAALTYTLQASATAFSPADASTNYFGSFPGSGVSSTGGQVRLYIPKAGTIKACFLHFFNATSNGTNEASTVSIRLNNTTDTTVTTSVDNSTTTSSYNNTALSIAVVAGDYIEIKWVAPTWVTNPAGVRLSAIIYVQPS